MHISGVFVDLSPVGGVPIAPLAVHLRSVVCLLDRFPALAGVDLDVAEGEAVLLSGPNGAGKTTLLRLLAGLVPMTAGSAVVLGGDLPRDRRRVRRSVGFLGSETRCYADLTVRENLRFWARAAEQPVVAADAMMERLGLERVADVLQARLSTGQRRRMALAVVVVRDPRLYLLDEPHAGLDVQGRRILDGLLADASRDGRTVVVASHEIDQVRTFAHREVTIVGGQIQPAAVFAR